MVDPSELGDGRKNHKKAHRKSRRSSSSACSNKEENSSVLPPDALKLSKSIDFNPHSIGQQQSNVDEILTCSSHHSEVNNDTKTDATAGKLWFDQSPFQLKSLLHHYIYLAIPTT